MSRAGDGFKPETGIVGIFMMRKTKFTDAAVDEYIFDIFR